MRNKKAYKKLFQKSRNFHRFFLGNSCWALLLISVPVSANDAWIEAHKKYNQALLNSPDTSVETQQKLQKKFIQPERQAIQDSLKDNPATRSTKFPYPTLGTKKAPERKAGLGKSEVTTKDRKNSSKTGKKSSPSPSTPVYQSNSPTQRRMGAVTNQPGGSAAPVAPPPPTEELGTMTEFGKRKKAAPAPRDVKFKVDEHQSPVETAPAQDPSAPQPTPTETLDPVIK